MTLVEVMVSFGIFAFAATGVVSGILQVQRLSLGNLAQSYAHTTAQSVMEELVRMPPSRLADAAQTSVAIKLPTLTTANKTTFVDFELPWSSDATTFTNLGSNSAGVLTDAAYIADSNTIRPDRYLPMRVNLQRTIENDTNRVLVVVRYQWQIPDRKTSSGAPIFLSGELRTVRSFALRF
jgi:type II secretory pathway pseudopilin PulG